MGPRKWLVYSNGKDTLVVPIAKAEFWTGAAGSRSGNLLRREPWIGQPLPRLVMRATLAVGIAAVLAFALVADGGVKTVAVLGLLIAGWVRGGAETAVPLIATRTGYIYTGAVHAPTFELARRAAGPHGDAP